MINQSKQFFVAVSAAIFLSGCMTPKSSIEDLASVNKATEVIVVGRIEIVPKIQKEEVSIKMAIGADDLYQKFILRVNTDIGETTNYTTDTDNMAVVKTEEDFYIPSNRDEPFNLFGGWFYTKLHGGGSVSSSVVFFQIVDGIKAEIPKGAGAIYVGTIKFKRDEFFNLKAISFEQGDYDAVQKRFHKKFNTNMPLVRVKVTKAKNSKA